MKSSAVRPSTYRPFSSVTVATTLTRATSTFNWASRTELNRIAPTRATVIRLIMPPGGRRLDHFDAGLAKTEACSYYLCRVYQGFSRKSGRNCGARHPGVPRNRYFYGGGLLRCRSWRSSHSDGG